MIRALKLNVGIICMLMICLSGCGGGSEGGSPAMDGEPAQEVEDQVCTTVCRQVYLCIIGEGCRTFTECFGCSQPENKIPVARFSVAPRHTQGGANVVLDGSASSDPEGAALTYHWALVSQPPQSVVSLENEDSAIVSFAPDKPGKYVVSLSVGDGARPSEVTHQIFHVDSPRFANLEVSTSIIPGATAIRGVLLMDANGDGINDLIMGNCSTVLLVYVRGSAGWSLSQSLDSGPESGIGICHVVSATGDFNGDDKSDFVMDNEVFIGNGDGTFELWTTLVGSQTIVGLSAGDFNGDGVDDIAVARETSAETRLYFGGAQLRESDAIANPLDRQAYVNDFNNDGIADLAFYTTRYDALGESQLSLVPGNRQESFSVLNLKVPGYGTITGGDVNADGNIDLVLGLLGGTGEVGLVDGRNVKITYDVRVATLLGQGDATFDSPLYSGVAEESDGGIAVADVDGDGKPDVLASGLSSRRLSVLLGDGSGRYTDLGIVDNMPLGFSIFGDADGDGLTDVVYPDWTNTHFLSGEQLSGF